MMPRVLRRALETEEKMRGLSRRIAACDRATFLGSGWDDITVLEAALKIRETCGLTASAYHSEQFLHGPVLSLDRTEAIVFVRSREEQRRADALCKGLRKTEASVRVIGEYPEASIRLPSVHAYLRPIVSVVPLQFLAYYSALARHANPDVMRTDIPRLRAGVEALFH